MRNWCSRRFASSWSTPSRTVIRRSLVMSSATGWFGFVAKRTSRFVRMPTSLPRLPFGPALDDRNARDAVALHQAERVREGLVREDGDRVQHHAGFELLHQPHLLGLRLRVEVAVDDAEPAVLRHGDRHAGFGHRVHRRGDDRQVEGDRAREPRLDVDVGRQDFGVARPQQHVVEGEAFDDLIG